MANQVLNKIVFTLTDQNQSRYYPLVKPFIESIRKNTKFDIYCIYDGYDNDITNYLKSKRVNMLYHRLSLFADIHDWNYQIDISALSSKKCQIYKANKEIYNFAFIRGEALKIDIPLVLKKYNINDEYVLYMDVDTLVLSDINDINNCISGSSIVYGKDDAGVMILNNKKLQESYDKFKEYFLKNKMTYEFCEPTASAAYRGFYREDASIYGSKFNWNVFDGINGEAKIVHFKWLKPHDYICYYNNHCGFHIIDSIADRNKISIMYYIKIWESYV